VFVRLAIRALLTSAFESGSDFPDTLVGSVGGKTAVGIARNLDEGFRRIDEAVHFEADGCNELVFVGGAEGVLGLVFLCVGGVIGWVEEGVDGIVVHDIAVVRKVMVAIEEGWWWIDGGHDVSDRWRHSWRRYCRGCAWFYCWGCGGVAV
jgi:hypothetical protein